MNNVYNPFFKLPSSFKEGKRQIQIKPTEIKVQDRIPRGLMWYRVRSGDTLTSIAQEFDTVALGLTMLNPSVNFNHLRAGTRIRLYANPLVPNCPAERQYIIGYGEDINSIARKLNTTTHQLLLANPLYPPSYFRQGNVICQPKN